MSRYALSLPCLVLALLLLPACGGGGSLDGIVFDALTESDLTGAVCLMEYRFTLDPATGTLSRGAFVSRTWNAVLAEEPFGGTPCAEAFAAAMARHLLT